MSLTIQIATSGTENERSKRINYFAIDLRGLVALVIMLWTRLCGVQADSSLSGWKNIKLSGALPLVSYPKYFDHMPAYTTISCEFDKRARDRLVSEFYGAFLGDGSRNQNRLGNRGGSSGEPIRSACLTRP